MKINTLDLVNFRTYDRAKLSFDRMTNIFYGKNGRGKTNLLEAIFYGAYGMSHRTSKEDEMMRFSSEGMSVGVSYSALDGDHQIRVKRFDDMGRFKKETVMDGKKVSAREHYGRLSVVMFSPEDLMIVKGEPALRRRFMDLEISQTDPVYYDLLFKYGRIMRQRNQLLKQIREGTAQENSLDSWDEEMSSLGAKLLIKRVVNLKQLEKTASPIFARLSGETEKLDLFYAMKANDGKVLYPSGANMDEDQIASFYLTSLRERRLKDTMNGSTGIGIHRDDIRFAIDGKDARSFGSQGQQRCCALAMKFSQIAYVKDVSGEYPVLLLDDVMSELDRERRTQIISFIDEKVQTFITVNDRELIPEFSANKYFEIDNGSINEI